MTKISRGNSGEKYNSVFATRLRRLFDEKPNVTQGQLAELLGVTRQTVSQYVNGISEPGYAALVKIADFFDVSIDYLLGRTETRTTELSVKEVCEMTGLNEHSILMLNCLNACSKGDGPLSGQDSTVTKYALCLVNEFIDFAFSSDKSGSRRIPCGYYLSFREQVERSNIAAEKWGRLSVEERNEIVSKAMNENKAANGVSPALLLPSDTAAKFYCNIFCDGFNNYLESKYPTKIPFK